MFPSIYFMLFNFKFKDESFKMSSHLSQTLAGTNNLFNGSILFHETSSHSILSLNKD